MSEVLRFRQARSPQRKQVEKSDLVLLYPDGISPFIQGLSTAQSTDVAAVTFLQDNQMLAPVRRTSLGDIEELDAFLTFNTNRIEQKQLLEAMDGPDEPVAITKFLREYLKKRYQDRTKIADGLVASLLAPQSVPKLGQVVTPELCDDFVRKITIFGLLELIGNAPEPSRSADEIFAALRWRFILLPKEVEDVQRRAAPPTHVAIFPNQAASALNRSRRLFVTRTGIADLFVLRSEWIRYEAGEIAHIENIMAKESKSRTHVRLDETETTATSETEVSTFNEQDSQTTERFELNEEASKDTDLAVHVDGQVNTSGQYGPTKVDSHIGGSLDYSQQDSQQRATTQARETVSRTVTRVEQRVRNERVARTLTRIEETNAHALTNETGIHFAGLYRWVDKVQRFQLFRYPNRLLLEFQVPEPAAWWRWLRGASADAGMQTKAPEPFTLSGAAGAATAPLLKFTDITEQNYAAIGARYATLGLEPPPSPVMVSEIFTKDTANPRVVDDIKRDDPVRYISLGDIAIPPGYVATTAWWRPQSWHEAAWDSNSLPSLLLSIGNFSHLVSPPAGGSFGPMNWDEPSYGPLSLRGILPTPQEYPGLTQAKIKVDLRTDNVRGFNIAVTVECRPSEETLTKWQILTYERLADSYYSLKRQHDEEANAARINAGLVIEGDSPSRNAQVIREQLKLGVLRMLFGDARGADDLPFTWVDLINRPSGPQDDKSAGPKAAEAALRAPLVQFLEQAFEWDKLTYVLYSYFWADNWAGLADIKSSDPEFASFLRSGSARVVVSAKPGFESHIQLFLDFGVIWGGGPVPVVNDPHYLSIAAEIRTLHQTSDEGKPCDWWDERLPTTLVWVDGANPLPEKPVAARSLGPPSHAP